MKQTRRMYTYIFNRGSANLGALTLTFQMQNKDFPGKKAYVMFLKQNPWVFNQVECYFMELKKIFINDLASFPRSWQAATTKWWEAVRL